MTRSQEFGASSQVVTLAMVAQAAGVSPSTVSRILTGHARVSDGKRKSVEEAIARLNYQPNVLARGLAQGRTLTLGVLTQDIDSPFCAQALRGVEDALAGTGMTPLFASGHWNVHDEAERMAHLLARRVDGIVVLTGRLTDEQLREYALRVPIVVTGRHLKGHNLTSLRLDDFRGAWLATRHLIELGHRRIAHIAGPQDHADSMERLSGYRKALQDAGIEADDQLVVHADFHEQGGVQAMTRLLDAHRPFSAVFASNDQAAYGARLALYQRHIRVPEDVSLIGFEDLPSSRYAIPPLSTVHQPVYELGQAAARTLLKMIEGGKARFALPEPQLVPRDSTQRLHA
jgi:LacI family transcriptional regulator